MWRRTEIICLAVLVATLAMARTVVAASKEAKPSSAAARPIEFNRDIRALLSDNCFACHGPDENKRKAKLRFDVKEDAFKPTKDGDYAIVPGDLKKSILIQRITSKDEEEVMPPPKTGKKLTAQQIDLLKRWISEGATWQTHWAYETP